MNTNDIQGNKYFEKKEKREKEEIKADRTRKTKKFSRYIVALIVLAAGIWFIYQRVEKENSAPPIGEFFPAQNRDHIAVDSEHPAYNSNPPTGGWHYAAAAQTGIYDKELPDEQLLHNLEHSHIWIAYRPDLDVGSVDRLAKIAKDYGSKIVMTPRQANDSLIALVAWQNLLKLDTVNENVIRQFIDRYRGIAGPEKLPDSGFKDFRNQ